jgi:hypothetical protein
MEIILLPEDLVNIIFSYIPRKTLVLTNKYYWKINYKESYDSKLQASYWRFILRNDFSFIFEEYISNSLSYFLKEKKTIYKSQIYPRKLELVNYLINFTFDSQKCKIVLDKIMKNKRLGFKKIRVKLNKWSN